MLKFAAGMYPLCFGENWFFADALAGVLRRTADPQVEQSSVFCVHVERDKVPIMDWTPFAPLAGAEAAEFAVDCGGDFQFDVRDESLVSCFENWKAEQLHLEASHVLAAIRRFGAIADVSNQDALALAIAMFDVPEMEDNKGVVDS